MHRNKSVSSHQFSMVPKADIPRSSFRMQKALKTTFDAGFLVPIFCEEILPGDSWRVNATIFGRLTTPLAPIMDNLYLDTFAFFVPNRLVWENWQKFMGEQDNPGDSISYIIPQVVGTTGGYPACSVYDYFGLPVAGQVDPAGVVRHNALPLRAYNLIWNQWFRDQNLQDSVAVPKDDGDDADTLYTLLARGKRHDYFTSALPFVQKGPSVTLPLGSVAPVISAGSGLGPTFADTNTFLTVGNLVNADPGTEGVGVVSNAGGGGTLAWVATNLVADLTSATAATINQLRESFQLQRFLERAARGGTRYTEIVRAQFGVMSPDARLQRPEFLGSGSVPVSISPIAQTSETGATTPQGNLAAMGTMLSHKNGFTQSFTEHGYVLMFASIRADLTYQQGLRRHWSRLTRYDYYTPVFAHLGEQAVLNKEIYCIGQVPDDNVFGYQERHAEYRYLPSEITGRFRSTDATPLDYWHLAQHFTALPTLSASFIEDKPPIERISAITDAVEGQQFLVDAFFDAKVARAMPMYAVPGLADHF